MAELLSEVRRQLTTINNKIDLADARQKTLDKNMTSRYDEVSARLERIETWQKDMD